MEIKDRIKECRDTLGKTQDEMADMLEIPKRTYASYERGEREVGTLILLKIATLCDVSVDYLLCRSDDKKSPPPATASDEQRKLKALVERLDDKELSELETFIDFLIYKRGH